MQAVSERATTVAEKRKAFAAALVEARTVRGLTQTELGAEVGIGQPGVSAWEAGENQPEPEMVFAVERVLELPPGHLSRHLGYMPPDSDGQVTATFEEVVMGDPLLDEGQKRAALALYREFTASRKPSPVRRRSRR